MYLLNHVLVVLLDHATVSTHTQIISTSRSLTSSSGSRGSLTGETEESLQAQRREAEGELMDTLSLRASLEQQLFMSHSQAAELSKGELPMSPGDQREVKSVMERYIACHRRLAVAREVVSQLSRKKVRERGRDGGGGR